VRRRPDFCHGVRHSHADACRYATHFLFDLPANPTEVACKNFADAGGGVAGLSAAVSLVLPPTATTAGEARAGAQHPQANEAPAAAAAAEEDEEEQEEEALAAVPCLSADLTEWWAYNPGFIAGAWVYQRCTEILMPVEVRCWRRCGCLHVCGLVRGW
jgi:hypothetical protein